MTEPAPLPGEPRPADHPLAVELARLLAEQRSGLGPWAIPSTAERAVAEGWVHEKVLPLEAAGAQRVAVLESLVRRLADSVNEWHLADEDGCPNCYPQPCTDAALLAEAREAVPPTEEGAT